jgi:3-hydroxybutyryl-CoA dehydrogenase
MGSGIALAALYQALPVVIYDISPAVLESAQAYAEKYLAKKGLQAYQKLLHLTSSLQDLAAAEFIIEAVPEDMALKQRIMAELDALCPSQTVLATNTSTLSVSAIAAATNTPARVIGLHFFNPAPVMLLVEVIRGVETAQETVDAAMSIAARLGKTPVVAADSPGFIVNRIARPFYGEALRLAGEGAADPDQLDLVATRGGGFRMGPFRLMDLIGIDVNLAAMQSMYERTFGEPRYRPHPLQAGLVAQKRLGVKTDRGFYRYGGDGLNSAPWNPPALTKHEGVLQVTPGTWGPGVASMFKAGGYQLQYHDLPPHQGNGFPSAYPPAGLVLAGRDEGQVERAADLDRLLSPTIPIICQIADSTLHEISAQLRHPERLVGFDGLFTAKGDIATLVSGPGTDEQIRKQVAQIFRDLGKHPVWITDSPGLVLPRIVSMLINEAAFAVLEGVAEPEMIDKAMQLGVNYPFGPVAWGRSIGFRKIVLVLDHLRSEYGEERYRASILLRRWANHALNPTLTRST